MQIVEEYLRAVWNLRPDPVKIDLALPERSSRMFKRIALILAIGFVVSVLPGCAQSQKGGGTGCACTGEAVCSCGAKTVDDCTCGK